MCTCSRASGGGLRRALGIVGHVLSLRRRIGLPSRNIFSRTWVRTAPAGAVRCSVKTPAEAPRDRGRLAQVGDGRAAVGGVRREVGPSVGAEVLGVLDVVEAPGDDALQRDGEGEERVRDAGVAPVEDLVDAVAEEHLAVVEVVVLHRLPDAVRRQPGAQLLDVLTRGQAPTASGSATTRSAYAPGACSRRSGRPSAELVDDVLAGDLDAGVGTEHVVPALQAALLLDSPPAANGRVGEQHPARGGVAAPVARGRDRPSAATTSSTAASWTIVSSLALNHTVPASVGTRITVDQSVTCGCSTSPVAVRPARRAGRRSTCGCARRSPARSTCPTRRASTFPAGRAGNR